MEDTNIRILPRVCGVCKDLILPPFKEQLCVYDFRKDEFLEVCRKCKDKGNIKR